MICLVILQRRGKGRFGVLLRFVNVSYDVVVVRVATHRKRVVEADVLILIRHKSDG